ncbi:DUF1616 domain-containing protein [Methanobacterium sp. SMA-27]|uniref:DUF1616 domain-containing protein n=1 Tax=Methanobacterium sp. SMA-27 TaxID=1495336 RepID=UPI00064FFC42|nr:DUF1616 domain-containing protein [Methanobacterium sp. SMA-27]
MKHLLSKDLGIIFLLTAIYILIISFPNLNYGKFIIEVGFLILLFLFIGYSIISLLRPEENYNHILHKPVLILEFSVLIILAVSLILKFSILDFNLFLLVMALSIITMFLSISAYIRRICYYKSGGRPAEITRSQKSPEKKSPQKKRTNLNLGYNKDLIMIDLLSIFTLSTFFIHSLNIGIVHNILGSLYMILLSGYVILTVFIPKTKQMDLRIILGLSICLSLPTSAIIGFVLNYTKYGISVNSISFVLIFLTLILGIYSHIRRLKVLKS